ncbi:putative E3 ubiquitin-protein ligase MARCH [Helianthus debilis subsp. tardiflorus]
MTEVILNVDEHFIYPASEIICCRICHEAEFESCKSLESPCSCSGTVKFAHRDCVQRWCDEKGNTNCEICLQVRFIYRFVFVYTTKTGLTDSPCYPC